MAQNDYAKALRLGQREYQSRIHQDLSPYVPTLDDILEGVSTEGEIKVGLMQIPADRIVGTYAAGRQTALAYNFMPLLPFDTEFASKWSNLCDAHLNEGIREPIKAYEYMNQYYVMEGNKRVSVLKYFGAVTITGNVTRIIPKRTEEKENKIYFEYLDFFKATNINYIYFSQEGSFEELMKAVGKTYEDSWSDDDYMDFRSAYINFQKAYNARDGWKLPITVGDAMLVYLDVFGYDALKNRTFAELKQDILKIKDEFVVSTDDSVELLLDPTDAPKKSLLDKILPDSTPKFLKVAFIHDRNGETSSWTYAHELGRAYVEQVLPDKVSTVAYNNISTEEETFDTIESAIDQGCNVIFTTASQMVDASLRAAVEHPQVKILNCSLNASHSYIRTYYARMYEAKFLTGALAAIMSPVDDIGYVAAYPVYGAISSINAFAQGAKMINPRVKVHLVWSAQKGIDVDGELKANHVSYVSYHEMIRPNEEARQYGLYRIEEDGSNVSIAMPIWDWGKQYVLILQSILNGNWKLDDADGKALNYWWGMSAGVVDILYSAKLPFATRRLIDFLRQSIIDGSFEPFAGILYGQEGVIQSDPNSKLTFEEIANMDWLDECIIGRIPSLEELTDSAEPLVNEQGVSSALQTP